MRRPVPELWQGAPTTVVDRRLPLTGRILGPRRFSLSYEDGLAAAVLRGMAMPTVNAWGEREKMFCAPCRAGHALGLPVEAPA